MDSRVICGFICVVMLAGTPGCLPTMDMPKDFIQVEKEDLGDYVMRNVSADGVVVALRTMPNMENGTLAFWSKAMINELTGRGYNLVSNEEVKSTSGLPGSLLTFSTSSRGSEFAYVLGLYVKNDTVIVAEAGGKASNVKEVEQEIRKSLLSVR